jgi:regulator of sigma E protease
VTALLFIAILAFLVFVHELGHFLAARMMGIRVDEFALGFPPKIIAWKRGETRYALNLIPFGGYVKIFGEDPDEESVNGKDASRALVNKKPWQKIVVFIAGIAMNVVVAWVLLSGSLMFGMTTGVADLDPQYVSGERVIVTAIMADSPAAKAGIRPGMEIMSVTKGSEVFKPKNAEAIQELVRNSDGGKLVFAVREFVTDSTVEVVPQKGVVGDAYGVGISMDLVGNVDLPFFKALIKGGEIAWNAFSTIFIGAFNLIGGLFVGTTDTAAVSGPIGIAKMVGEAKTLGVAYLASFTAFISLNLAALNLLPFPALDGGRIVFVIGEWIARRQIPSKVANITNVVGFALLMLLMLAVTVKDVIGLF